MLHYSILAFFLVLTLFHFQASADEAFSSVQFGERLDLGLIEHDAITEASGIVASQKTLVCCGFIMTQDRPIWCMP